MVAAVEAKGYAATSVADVLVRAQVSRSAFYAQFRDKEDCFLACYDWGTGLVLEAATTALDAAGPWRQRIRRVYQNVLDTFAQYPHLARVCMVEALAAGPAAIDRYRDAIAALVELLERDMVDHADVPQVPRLVLLSLIGGTSNIIYEEILAGRTIGLPALADDLTRLWLAAFLGYAAAGDTTPASKRGDLS
jgi:AcrR family transcriptional regulator